MCFRSYGFFDCQLFVYNLPKKSATLQTTLGLYNMGTEMHRRHSAIRVSVFGTLLHLPKTNCKWKFMQFAIEFCCVTVLASSGQGVICKIPLFLRFLPWWKCEKVCSYLCKEWITIWQVLPNNSSCIINNFSEGGNFFLILSDSKSTYCDRLRDAAIWNRKFWFVSPCMNFSYDFSFEIK